MVILSHPTGNPFVRAALRGLAAARLLEAFYTTFGFSADRAVVKLLPRALRLQIERRGYREIPPERLRLFPWRELVRLSATRVKLNSLIRHEYGWASADAVYRSLDAHVAAQIRKERDMASVVYAYEDGALATFGAARERGMQCVYDLPIAYWRLLHQLLVEERDRRPEWAATMEGLADSPAKQQRKDLELAQADCVVVASNFTRQSLAYCPQPPKRIEVASYGAPPVVHRGRAPGGEHGRPLRALFVGHLSQRKGLADLHEAMSHVQGLVTLTLVGPRTTRACAALDQVIQTHRWIPPVAHSRVLKLMAAHDVLVFPSIVEGFGMVITEALSRGLPVITTPHTGGPDFMVDGREGFIVPIRDPDAIADRLTILAEDQPRLVAMSDAARRTAAMLPWERYERRLADLMVDRVRKGA